MNASETTNGTTPGAGSFSPPYGSWVTLLNTVERMAKEGGIPAQIDRSYLSNLPGSTQTELLQSMKSLGLIDEQMRPTKDLEAMVEDAEGRAGVVSAILAGRYEGPLALGPFATQQQLEDEFRKYNIQGSTLRKAVRFFLAAAKYADVPLSPHFRPPKDPARPRTARRQTAAAPPPAPQPQQPAPPKPLAIQHHPLVQGLFQE